MIKILIICLGGSLGAYLRFIISAKINDTHTSNFPYGTIIVNIIGCFFIGFLWHLAEQMNVSTNLKLFLFVGLLGAFTTFSTFGLESHNLFVNNDISLGMLNILASNILGIFFVFLGLILSKNIFQI
ncbi:MAG: fluoride efflux transporter CrcB [Candidatus Dadabacteria bacterium]|nr:fluoride efflux transporter CrcB [Candidatus Dadabacteria bacterium]NIQ16239.1 fluoride efflux transporter CrcB [Candidatus Dadabacteria bacterium]